MDPALGLGQHRVERFAKLTDLLPGARLQRLGCRLRIDREVTLRGGVKPRAEPRQAVV